MRNKKVKQMLYSVYCDLHCEYAADSIGIEKYMWAFDRLRLCEMGFERNKLRYPEFSKISLTANQLKGIK